ncbi:MAG: hypothetical protein AAF752_12170, partial [Bacteroidota bacterium]
VSQPTMDAVPGSYYVVLSHRNHHAAMTSRSISGSSGTLTIDFRASLGFGANAQQRLPNGQYALWGGNADVLNNTTNGDAVAWVSENGTEGEYVLEDFDLNGFVDALDIVGVWQPARGRGSKVPN